jgi:hypothetical protein
VHVSNNEVSPAGKAILLEDIINNIESIDPNYYQKVTL